MFEVLVSFSPDAIVRGAGGVALRFRSARMFVLFSLGAALRMRVQKTFFLAEFRVCMCMR